jgi:ABC-type branched-subunit amino acid transport system substrate-binding protein
VTDTTITLSSVGSFSGPYAQIYEAVYQASTGAWAAEVNAKGGINGRMIEIKKVDDKYTVEGAVAACKEIESNGSFAAFTQGLFAEGQECLDKAGVPSQMTTGNTDQFPWTTVHSVTSNKSDGTAVANYVAGSGGLAKPGSTVGVVYVADQPALLATATFFDQAAGGLGLKVEDVKVRTGQASFTAEVQRLKDAGIGVVVLFGTTEALGVLRDANAIGYTPRWVGHSFVADEFSQAMGPDLFKGVVGLRQWATTDTKAWSDYMGVVNKYGKLSSPPTTTGMNSFEALRVMEQALRLAGKNLTRQSLLAAYGQIKDLDLGGIPPVSYDGGRVVGASKLFKIECCDPDKTWKGTGPAV